MSEGIGTVGVWLGLIVYLLGLICFNFCRDLNAKLLSTAIMESCGLMTFMIGAMFLFSFGMHTVKVVLILVTVLVITPITSHEIARLSKRAEEKYEAEEKKEEVT